MQRDALHEVANGLSDCHSDLKDKFNRLFDQIVRTDGDKPEPVNPAEAPESEPTSRWSTLFAEWLRIEAEWSKCDGDSKVPDEVGNRLGEEEGALVLKLAAAKPQSGYEVAQKLTVLEKYMSGDDWADRRDWLLLASLKRDVVAGLS